MGSLARVIGPLAVAEIYELWGTYVLFITVTTTLVLSFVITLVFWRQLVAPIDTVANNQVGTQPSNQLKEEDEANIEEYGLNCFKPSMTNSLFPGQRACDQQDLDFLSKIRENS